MRKLRHLTTLLTLVMVLAWYAPAQAQSSGTTSFTVTLSTLAISVSPSSISLGTVSAGGTTNSPPTIGVTNTGNVSVNLSAAGTNAQQLSPFINPSWALVTASPGANQFRWGFSNSQVALTFLPGPGSPGGAFPTTGSALTMFTTLGLGSSVANSWQFNAPTSTSYLGQQQFQVVISASP